MREIKFRAWDKDLKRWCFSTEVTLEGSGQYVHHHYPKSGHQPNSVNEHEHMVDCPHIEAIMQYTGLKDKNGKEIYEGDIIEVGNKMPYKTAVQWSEKDAAYMVSPGGDFLKKFVHNPFSRLEVIDNIYENPELNK